MRRNHLILAAKALLSGSAAAALLILAGGAQVPACAAPASSSLRLWYLQPAGGGMNEALPIGNGRMGGLIYGGPASEQIVFKEDSLWTGDKNPTGDYGSMGSYQKFGEIDINLPGQDFATGYRRDLDLTTATSHVTYRVGSVTFSREYFASHPAQALVGRLTASEPGAYTGSLTLAGAHSEKTQGSDGRLTFFGTLPNGIAYEAQLQVIAAGGALKTVGDTITFNHCNSLTLILGTGTSYVMDFARNYQGDDPHARVTRQVDAASAMPYAKLRRDHIADYSALFSRVRLNLGASPAGRDALPTDARKILAATGDDPGMVSLLFQYGRYLLLSCSRPGSLPANLQGLWNDSNSPPWSSDYHTDINIEMNYWPAEVANLSECTEPLIDLVQSQLPSWRTLTAAEGWYKLPDGTHPPTGWDARASFNITGGMGWLWIKTADAWILQTYWEHYAFTGDKTFLRETAYPALKEVSQFWAAELKAEPDGTLMAPGGWSPEHGDFEDGVSFDQELVWDLFNNTIAASRTLGVDDDLRARLVSMQKRLAVPKIGKYGQLQEWLEDKDDPSEHHRHTSQLVGVFPGHQFTPATPQYLAAAKVALKQRGNTGDVTEWALAWRAALYTRMLDGNAAYGQLIQFFAARNSCVSLFGYCPPMQIDGNFGTTATIAEMLLQSQNGAIDLLPAMPSAWREGSVHGLRARGGYTVDETWSGGKLAQATIHSAAGGVCNVEYGGKRAAVRIGKGGSVTLRGDLRLTIN